MIELNQSKIGCAMNLDMNGHLDGKILIIDDESMVRKSIATHLADSGFEVFEADNAEAGLVIFRAEHPDLILTDIQMPGMPGLELLAIICAEMPDIPVIMMSGVGVMEDVVKSLRLGAWDYLIKPIADLGVLEHTILKCLERAKILHENKLYRAELEEKNVALRESLATLEEDQVAGRSMQISMLPDKEHSFHSYIISHSVKPSLYLSGDFVDHFEIDGNHFGFYIADVSGHGAASAFVTVLLKSMMDNMVIQYQSHHVDTILHPEKVLAHLSSEIYKAKLGKYLTMIYCVLNIEANELTYSIGGHYPCPVMKTETQCYFIEQKGFPIGIFDKAVYQAHRLSFPDSFTFAMFSDGVLEILPERALPDKEKRLLDVVRAAGWTVRTISDDLALEKITELLDDVTLLVLHKQENDSAAKINFGVEKNIGILALTGDLRFGLAPPFERAVKKLIGIVDLKQCVVDLEKASFIDSTMFGMIGSLIELKKSNPNLEFTIVASQEPMRDSVVRLGFDRYFKLEKVAPECSTWITFSQKQENRENLKNLVKQAHENLMSLGADDAKDYQTVLDQLKKN